MEANEGDLKVWWGNNITRFYPNCHKNNKDGIYYYPVKDVEEAKKVIDVLTWYDLSLGDAVDMNMQGLVVYEDNEWVEYYDEEGRDIQQIIKEEIG